MSNRLDSRSLALFLAVADTLSFRQAAETLHMSQPPLSRAIRELEERLGMPLFVRNTRGVVLTDAGHRLLPYARRVARLLRDAEAELTAPGLPRALRLGLTNAVEPAWFDGLVERLQAKQPEMAVSVLYDTSPRLVRQLRSGKLDAAFVALPTDVRGLTVLHLDCVPMMVAMHSTHRLAKRRAISLADIGSEPVFWFERARQPAFYDHCQQIFTRHGFAPSTLREPNDHHILLADVARGRGLALLPGSFAGLKRAGVVYKKLVEGAELGVGIGLVNPNEQETMRRILVMAADIGDARQQAASSKQQSEAGLQMNAHCGCVEMRNASSRNMEGHPGEVAPFQCRLILAKPLQGQRDLFTPHLSCHSQGAGNAGYSNCLVGNTIGTPPKNRCRSASFACMHRSGN